MYSVPLEFLPPEEEDIVALRIYESPASDGTFTLIETVSAVGTYPTYINKHTTTFATSPVDWFAIQWVDSNGALSSVSDPVKGGTKTLVGEIVDRVLLRDASFNELIAAQEAEYIISRVFNVSDPYTLISTDAAYRQIAGMTDFVFATCKFNTMIELMSVNSYTAGAISESSSNVKPVLDAILMAQKTALRSLGLTVSVIGQLKTPATTAETSTVTDISRLLSVSTIKEITITDLA